MKKKVFLLADIGTGKNGFYHVGDEAMFLSNLEKYREMGVEVFASSRSVSHPTLTNHEVLDIYILNIFHFIKLVVYAFFLRFFGLNMFPKFFRKTVKTLTSCDVLHISGGGNITSLWPGHIYYRSLMIFIAKLYGKKVILTGQSVGPITRISLKYILYFALNAADYIGIREKKLSLKTIDILKIKKDIVHFNYDDALFWQVNTKQKTISKKVVNLGISLHDPKNVKITMEMSEFLAKILRKYKNLNLFVIPHMIDSKDDQDISFALSITRRLNSKRIKVVDFKYLNKIKGSTYANKIRSITAKMDLIVASRYHGLVFAVSSLVPCLAINYDDDYYRGKNTGFLETVTGQYKDFVIDFRHIKSDYILSKFNKIYLNQKVISVSFRNFLNKAYEEDKKTKNLIYRLEWNAFKI